MVHTLHLGTNTVVTLLVQLNARSLYFEVYDCSSLSYIYITRPHRNTGQSSSAIHIVKVLDKRYNFVISKSSIAASPGKWFNGLLSPSEAGFDLRQKFEDQ